MRFGFEAGQDDRPEEAPLSKASTPKDARPLGKVALTAILFSDRGASETPKSVKNLTLFGSKRTCAFRGYHANGIGQQESIRK